MVKSQIVMNLKIGDTFEYSLGRVAGIFFD